MKLPKWAKAIPESQAHGSGSLQKRLWRVVSDYVRIRDWYKYKGRCVATGRLINHWTDGQAGHFISYAKCNGMFKFDVRNIHLQSARSNSWGDYEDWKGYEQELKRRGLDVEFLHSQNRSTQLKLYDTDVIEEIRSLLEEFKELPEKPAYYQRVMELL